MYSRYVYLVLVLYVVLSLVGPGVVLSEERPLLVIRKEIRFNVTVIAGDNGTTRTVVMVLDFYFINAEPSDSDVNISFPVVIRVGDRVINKTVVVPLRIRGELEKIVVVSVDEEGGGSGSGGEIVVYYPGSSGESGELPGSTGSGGGATGSHVPVGSNSSNTVTVTKTMTETRTVTRTVVNQGQTRPPQNTEAKASAPGSTRARGIAGQVYGAPDYVPLIIMLVGLGVAATVIVMAMRRPKVETVEKQNTPQHPAPAFQPGSSNKELKAENPGKPGIPRLRCPVCGETIDPIVTDDNRLVCPACHTQIGRIREDGALELQQPITKPLEPSNLEEKIQDSKT